MTEVPEHLLRRSRERREALGLATPGEGGGGGGGGDAAPVPAAAAPAAAQAAPVEAAPPPEPEPAAPPRPRPPASRLPAWVTPVLAGLPLWAFFYLGAFGDLPARGPVKPNGAQIFATSCASCHGATGGGGVGPKLSDGEVLKTFPNEEDHIKWVVGGSIGGTQPYGDPNRAGGQRRSAGGMPGFGNSLSEAQIKAVVEYEREL